MRAASGARARCAVIWLTLIALLVGCTGGDLAEVEVAELESATVVQTISAPAVVEAVNRQPVAAGVSGVVAKIEVADGDVVQAGDVVVQLASDQVALALEQAEAAQAAIAGQSGVTVPPPGDAAIQAAHASVAELDADVQPDLAQARQDAAAIEDPEAKATTNATLDVIEESYRKVRRALLRAGEAAAAQQNAIAASFGSALDQALAQASSAQQAEAAAAADAARAQAQGLELTAPFTGVVQLGEAASSQGPRLPPDLAGSVEDLSAAESLGGGRQGGTLRVGVPVSAGQTVFTIFDLSELYVEAGVDEVDAPQLRVGQDAEVLIDAFPDRTFRGVVEEVAIEGETSPAGGVGYSVRIRLFEPPAEDGPRLGMTASADISTRAVDADRAVPSRAIVRRDGGEAVYVVRDGVARLVAVRVLALGDELAAVEARQLAADDLVVVSGYEDLEDGDPVRVLQR